MDSILNATKKTMGIMPEYSAFDHDILMHINAALAVIVQLGVGAPLVIEDETKTWAELGITAPDDLSMVKNLVYLKTRLGFDPPQTSFSIEAIERQIRELEFRLNVNREEDQWTDPNPIVVEEV